MGITNGQQTKSSMEETMRICSMCAESKPLDEYYDLREKGKKHARCKECFKKKQYEYYERNKENYALKKELGYYELRKEILRNGKI